MKGSEGNDGMYLIGQFEDKTKDQGSPWMSMKWVKQPRVKQPWVKQHWAMKIVGASKLRKS